MKREIYKVSSFRRKEDAIPSTIYLWDWLLRECEYTPIVEQIRSTKDDEYRKRLKCQLPAITPSGLFSGRCAESLVEPTNLICIDIDGKDNPSISDLKELKSTLGKLPYVMYCGLSVSGNGVFCIIPYSDYRDHKLHFNALESEFRELGIVVDSSCSDICRLRFYSCDRDPYVNIYADVYSKTLGKCSTNDNSTRVYRERQSNISSQELHQQAPPNNLSLEEALLQPTNLDNVVVIPESKTFKAKRFFETVLSDQVDITEIYGDWIYIAGIIKTLFGKDGEELFHRVSSFYPKYRYEESEHTYQSIDFSFHYRSDRLKDIGAKYGVEYY
ncbi:MAG: BT4734/BF3469 family protein [Rikenellaceae bacterium]